MSLLLNLFNINTIFFTIFNYPMSYIEFFGTILTIWCVWLTSKAKIISWPVGIIGSMLYLALFYQIQLYSDLFEQIYFIITSFFGWYLWVSQKKDINKDDATVVVSVNSSKENYVYTAVVILGTILLSFITINLSLWLPRYFPEPVSLPVLDAVTTVMSFVAQWLLMKKKLESWLLWIIVDAIDIGLYWFKGVRFISIEYLLFFFIAIIGLINWTRIYKANQK